MPVPVPIGAATRGGTTLLAIRQLLAQELGKWLGSTATGGTPMSLVDATWPVLSSNAQDDYYVDYFILRPNATLASDRVRTVFSYTPATGTLTPDTGWTVAPAAGEAYELHGVIEPSTSLLFSINEALKRTMVAVEVTMPPTANYSQHDLNTVFPWLTDPAWVRQVGWLGSSENRTAVDPYRRIVRGQTMESGLGVILQHPGFFFNATDTLYLRVYKRAYDHCRPTGGLFGDQAGLILDTDLTPADPAWVVSAALIECWRRFSQALDGESRSRYQPSLQDAVKRFTYLTAQQWGDGQWPLTFVPLRTGGPRYTGGGLTWAG